MKNKILPATRLDHGLYKIKKNGKILKIDWVLTITVFQRTNDVPGEEKVKDPTNQIIVL